MIRLQKDDSVGHRSTHQTVSLQLRSGRQSFWGQEDLFTLLCRYMFQSMACEGLQNLRWRFHIRFAVHPPVIKATNDSKAGSGGSHNLPSILTLLPFGWVVMLSPKLFYSHQVVHDNSNNLPCYLINIVSFWSSPAPDAIYMYFILLFNSNSKYFCFLLSCPI